MEKLETLGYGFVRTDAGLMAPADAASAELVVPTYNLFLDCPSNVFDQVQDIYPGNELQHCNPIVKHSATPDKIGGERLVINFDAIDKMDSLYDQIQKVKTAGHIMNVLDSFYDTKIKTEKDYRDPKISISRSAKIAHGKNPGLVANVLWPEQELVTDAELAKLAGERMVAVAKAFEYKTHHDTDKIVFALVNRASGVELHVDSGDHTRTLHTAMFHRNDEKFLLVENDLIKDYRRLICLTGAVAIAHADQLLPKATESDTITE